MRYVCVHCDHTWEADDDQPPRRCPACMRANGPQLANTGSERAAPARRSKPALLGLALASLLAAVAGYFVWGKRPTAGERSELGPLTGATLDAKLEAEGVRAGELEQLLAPDDRIAHWAEQAAGSARSPYEKAEAVTRAIRARASALAFVPWSLGEPRATPIGTAAETLAKLEQDKARHELYPLELAALEAAALRALEVPAMVAELVDVGGEKAPLDPSGYLGYFVVAVYPGDPGIGTPRLFDPYGGRPLLQGGKHTVLKDTQAIGAALATRALHELSYLADPKRALESSASALTLAGSLPSVRSVRGLVMLAGRLAEQGMQELTAARQLRDDPPRKHNLASAALMTGELDRAGKELEAALARTPDYAAAHATLGTLALIRGDTDQARASLQKAEQLAPDLTAVKWARVELALRDGDSEQALTLARRALAARPSFDARLRMAMLLRQLGRTDELRALSDELVGMVPATRKDEVRSLLREMLGATALDEPSATPAADAGDGSAEPRLDLAPPSSAEGAARQVGRPARGRLRLGEGKQQLQLKLDP